MSLEKLKQVVEELWKKTWEWNQKYDDTMEEEMKKDVIEVFRKYGFEKLEGSDEAIYELYKKTNRGFEQVFNYRKLEKLDIIVSVEGIIEFLERNNFELLEMVDGFYTDIWYDTYLIFHKNNSIVVVREHTICVEEGSEITFYELIGAFKLKE